MVTAKVLAPITHLGRHYAVGQAIEVDPSTAHQLVAAGVIAIELPAPAAPKKDDVSGALGAVAKALKGRD